MKKIDRRLEAGDWVVATRDAATTAHGLGKLSGGEYDPKHGALVRARVELASGVRWIDAGELSRVEPEDEVALTERVLELGLVPEPRAARVRALLEGARGGERGFVRTPGLLDAVWATLDDPLGAPGLVGWFEGPHRLSAHAPAAASTGFWGPPPATHGEPRPSPAREVVTLREPPRRRIGLALVLAGLVLVLGLVRAVWHPPARSFPRGPASKGR